MNRGTPPRERAARLRLELLEDRTAPAISIASLTNPAVFGQAVTFTGTTAGAADQVRIEDITSGLAVLATGVANRDSGRDFMLTVPMGAAGTQTPTAVAVASSPNPSVFGQPVTFTAIVTATTPGAPTPVGAVTFSEGATVLKAHVGLDSAGQAVFGTSALSVGSHTITVSYLGAGVFHASAGTQATPQVVIRAATAMTMTGGPVTSVFGQAVTLTATVGILGAGAGTPTGTVTFREGAAVLGSGSVDATGHATFTTASLRAGFHSISSAYGGDGNFTGCASSTKTFTVETPTAVAVASSPNPSVFGQPVTFTATVTATTPGLLTPVGSVTFSEGATVLKAQVGLGEGQAVFGTSNLSVGSHTITVTYAGAGVFLASSGSNSVGPQVVGRASTAMIIGGGPSPSAFGQPVMLTASVGVLAPGAGAPTGTVTFSEGGTALGTGAVAGTGQAAFSTAALSAGFHTVTATYAGDSRFFGSAAGSLPLTVKTLTTTSLSSAPAPSVFGQYVRVTATVRAVAAGLGTPFGTVTFSEGGTVLAANLPTSGGQAILSTAALGVGSHTITASYTPSSIFLASSGNDSAAPQVVNRAATWTSIGSSASTAAKGQAVTFFATLHATAPGFGTPTGAVAFREGTATLDATGRAIFNTAALSAGTHTITTSYAGDGRFLASSGTNADSPQVIKAFTSSTSITSSANPAIAGQAITFTATVTSPGGTPTGTVDFTDAPGAPGSTAATQVWFAPNLNSDVLPLFQRPQDWQTARSHMSVFKLEEPSLGDNPPPYFASPWQRLQTVKLVQTLKAWNIGLAFDAGVIKPEYLADPSLAIRDAQTSIAHVAAAGGAVRYVSMDEPYDGGSIKYGSMSTAAIADRVAAFMRSVTTFAPSVQVGDIEPYPAIGAATIESFVNALISRGTKPAFFHIDLNFGFVNSNPNAAAKMRVDMPALRDFFAAKGISFGIIFWSGGTVARSDQDYSAVTLHNVDVLKSAMGVPVQSIFQSWVPNVRGDQVYPTNLPESQPYTHTWLIDQGVQHLLSPTLAAQVPLVGGRATFSISTLALGNHTITASYSGAAAFAASLGDNSAAPQVVRVAKGLTAAIASTPRATPVALSAAVRHADVSSLSLGAVDDYFAATHRLRAVTTPPKKTSRQPTSASDWIGAAF